MSISQALQPNRKLSLVTFATAAATVFALVLTPTSVHAADSHRGDISWGALLTWVEGHICR